MRRLLALGHGVGENHQTQSTASLALILLTVTHSAGVGSFDGFHQKNSCARWNPTSRVSIRASSYWYRLLVGCPGVHAPPMSMTSEPVGLRIRLNCLPNGLNHSRYSWASTFPYFFFRTSPKGGACYDEVYRRIADRIPHVGPGITEDHRAVSGLMIYGDAVQSFSHRLNLFYPKLEFGSEHISANLPSS
jgi:hypothetical protein